MGALFRPLLTALALGSVAIASLAGPAAAAQQPLTMNVNLSFGCVTGKTVRHAPLKVTIRAADNTLKAKDQLTADGRGRWMACPSLVNEPIVGGDRITVSGKTTNELLDYRVPLLTLTVERTTDVVSGKAPAGSKLELEAIDQNGVLLGRAPFDVVSHVKARADGTYRYDFSRRGVDLIAGTELKVHTTTMGGRIHVQRTMAVPGVFLFIGQSSFQGYTRPYQAVEMTLSTGGQTVATGTGVGSDFLLGVFGGRFVDPDGEPYRVRGGEWFSAPALGSDASWPIPKVDPVIAIATDKVSATCFANSPYVVIADTGMGAIAYGSTGASGKFKVDLSSQGNIEKGTRVTIGCFTASGDVVIDEVTAH